MPKMIIVYYSNSIAVMKCHVQTWYDNQIKLAWFCVVSHLMSYTCVYLIMPPLSYQKLLPYISIKPEWAGPPSRDKRQ